MLDRASRGWRGLTYTPAITPPRQLTEIRGRINKPDPTIDDQPTDTEPVTAVA